MRIPFIKYTRDNFRNTPGLRSLPIIQKSLPFECIFDLLDRISKELQDEFNGHAELYNFMAKDCPETVKQALLKRGIDFEKEELEWEQEIGGLQRVKDALLRGELDLSPSLRSSFPNWEEARDRLNPNNAKLWEKQEREKRAQKRVEKETKEVHKEKIKRADKAAEAEGFTLPPWQGDKTLQNQDVDLSLED